jgi:cytochrome c-type biogenesis protein CcsB
MNLTETSLFWIALFSYLGATLLFSLHLTFKKAWFSHAAQVILLAGFASHTLAMAFRWIFSGHPPLIGMYDFANSLAWVIVFFYLGVRIRFGLEILGLFVSPLAFAVIVIASLFPSNPGEQLIPVLQSYWVKIHVAMAVLSEGTFAVAFASSTMYLLRRFNRLKAPSLEVLDDLTYKAVLLGYPLFTLGGLFAGAVWAQMAWGSLWSFDPKQVGSLAVWLVYSAFLHTRFAFGWSGARSAWLSIAGFLCAVVSFIVNLFFPVLHVFP